VSSLLPSPLHAWRVKRTAGSDLLPPSFLALADAGESRALRFSSLFLSWWSAWTGREEDRAFWRYGVEPKSRIFPLLFCFARRRQPPASFFFSRSYSSNVALLPSSCLVLLMVRRGSLRRPPEELSALSPLYSFAVV